ncbi:MAG: DsbC family protein [Hydrogenophaga sp.]
MARFLTLASAGAVVMLLSLGWPKQVCASETDGAALPATKVAALRSTIEGQTQGKVKVKSVRSTPIQGIYLVETGTEVFYVDESGRYGFAGAALIDMQRQKDLTAGHMERMQRIDFQELPLQHAIKEVRGNGSRQLAVFEDPNCPICKVFTKFVDQLTDVTVYKFPFPVIAPDSIPLARMAWCAPERGSAWRAIMAGQRPTDAPQNCDTSGLVEILKVGERYGIQNTPTVVLANGKRLVGATPPEQFITELDASTASVTSRR